MYRPTAGDRWRPRLLVMAIVLTGVVLNLAPLDAPPEPQVAARYHLRQRTSQFYYRSTVVGKTQRGKSVQAPGRAEAAVKK